MYKYLCEGIPDECLLHNLGVAKTLIQQLGGRGPVCKALSQGKSLIGLVDEDPGASHHSYFKSLVKKPESDKFGILYCSDKRANNKLIILKTNFESWLIYSAKLTKINMADFGLSEDPNVLHSQINFNIGKLQSALHAMRKKECKPILHLAKLLSV
jgi:hypothetical protein